MADYKEIKTLILKIAGYKEEEIANCLEEDICFKLDSNFPPRITAECDTKKTYVIKDEELKALFDKVSHMSTKGSALYDSQDYEVAIELDRLIKTDNKSVKDNENSIIYTVGEPSIEYCMHICKELANKNRDKDYYSTVNNIKMRVRRNLRYKESVSGIPLLQLMFNDIYTLKISQRGNKKVSSEHFAALVNSFAYDYMYSNGTKFIVQQDSSGFIRPFGIRLRRSPELPDAPCNKYQRDVVDYYKRGIASDDPFIKFISFYHVVEYYYEEGRKEFQTMKIKNLIQQPDFSRTDGEKIYKFGKKVANVFKNTTDIETGRGSESETLNYIIAEYVIGGKDDKDNRAKLLERLKQIDTGIVDYYSQDKNIFCTVKAINFEKKHSDKETLAKQIGERIYNVRNSLVHSKSNRDDRYNPYEDKEDLMKEYPLVQAVSELIIYNSRTSLF